MTTSTPGNQDNKAEQIIPLIQKVTATLWPSFITAGIATILFFTAFDPEVVFVDYDISRMGAYSIGFFMFWALTSSSCALSLFYMRPCESFNKKK